MAEQPCPDCGGARLRPESLAVKVGGISIAEYTRMSARGAAAWIAALELTETERAIARLIVREISERLAFLENVGIGYLLDYYRREVDRPPYELQAAFVLELTRRGIVRGASCRRHFSPFLIPVGGPLRHPGRGRVLLAGDAGGFVNGFTAEGIYYAMVSGQLAARAVLESASRGVANLAARYRHACNAEIGAELRDSVVLQRFLFADRRRISTMVESASAGDALTRRVLEVVAGRADYGRLRRTLRTSPHAYL